MKQYIYINNQLRFRIDDAPFPHTHGIFAELQEKVPVLLFHRWVTRDSRILATSDAELSGLPMPQVMSNYDGTITEVWSEDRFNLKDRLKQIANQYIDSIAVQQYHHAMTSTAL